MRIVADTHVLISGTSNKDGYPGNIVIAWRKRQLEVAISPPILIEIQRVLTYSFVTDTLHWTDESKRQFLETLKKRTVYVTHVSPAALSNDKKDNMWFACAKAAGAAYIVSKDDHLLEVGEFDGIKVVKPGYFVEQVLKKRKSGADLPEKR